MSFFSLFNVSSSIPSLPHLSSRFSTADLFFFHVFLYYFPFFTSSLVFLTVLSFLPFSNYFFFYSVAPTQFLRPVFIPSPLYFSPIPFYLSPLMLSSCPSHLNIYLAVFPPTHPFLICPSIHPAFLFLPFNIAFLLPSFCFSHGYFSFVFLPSTILFITFIPALFGLLFIVKAKKTALPALLLGSSPTKRKRKIFLQVPVTNDVHKHNF